MDTFSDEQLARLAAAGDKIALETLVARYLGPVYRFNYSYVGNREDAEDMTQEVFVKVWRNLHRFDPAKSFRAWLYTVAKHTCLDLLKKKSAVPFSALANELGEDWFEENIADDHAKPEAAVDQILLEDRLGAAVGELRAEYAQVVTLHHQRDLNFRQIAGLTKEPLNTVKSRYRRAIQALRRLLAQNPKV